MYEVVSYHSFDLYCLNGYFYGASNFSYVCWLFVYIFLEEVSIFSTF
jgi:hypothetical protein